MKTKSIASTLKLTFSLCLSLLVFSVASAQKDTTSFAKKKAIIEAQKSAYITTKLELTTAEAQVFWPVYNEYDAKKETIMKANRENNKKIKNIETLSDKETQAIIDEQLANEEKLLALKKEYTGKFTKVLSVKKVVKLEIAEREFRKELLKAVKGPKKQALDK